MRQMATRARPHTGEATLKQRYQVTNGSEYYRARLSRGNMTIGARRQYQKQLDARAIGRSEQAWAVLGSGLQNLSETIKALLQLPYRATEGLVKPMMHLRKLDLPVPDHTTCLSARLKSRWKSTGGRASGQRTWWSTRLALKSSQKTNGNRFCCMKKGGYRGSRSPIIQPIEVAYHHDIGRPIPSKQHIYPLPAGR